MPRPKQNRRIQAPPRIKGLNPTGVYRRCAQTITLAIEEYESIRLLDYERFSQEEAASLMMVSRPTLTRIYNNARKKMAKLLTEGSQMIIEGGNTFYDQSWYECNNCKSRFNNLKGETIGHCPLCKSKKIDHLT